MARKKETKQKGVWQGLVFLVIVLIIALFISLVSLLPQFYIEDVKVEGTKAIKQAELIQGSDIQTGKHLFYYLSGSIPEVLQMRYVSTEDKLKNAFPYIENIRVGIKFPYHVAIEVEEYEAFAKLESNELYYVLDDSGLILEKKEDDALTKLPLIKGISISKELVAGEHISEENSRQYDRAKALLAEIKRIDNQSGTRPKIGNKLSYVYPYSANTMYFELKVDKDVNLIVKINPSLSVTEKILWLQNALDQDVLLDLGQGILDMSGEHTIFKPHEKLPKIEK